MKRTTGRNSRRSGTGSGSPPVPFRVILPGSGLLGINLSELWSYRELLYFLAWKEVKIRYKQTVLGAAWAVIQPLFTMVIFTLIFGNLARMPSDGVPYPVFSYAGLVLWTYFSGALSQSSNSLLSNANLISKVYFPRLLLPLSACLVGLLDYSIALTVLVGLMVYFHIVPTAWILLAPVPLLLAFLLASGMGFWLSAVAVRYRDVGYAIPFFVQLLLFASPVIYPAGLVAGSRFGWLLQLNPLSGIMTTQRAVMLGNAAIDWPSLGLSSLVTLLIFLGGLAYFKACEREFADAI